MEVIQNKIAVVYERKYRQREDDEKGLVEWINPKQIS